MPQGNQDPNNKKKNHSFKDKLNEYLNFFKTNQNVDGLYTYAKYNTRDVIAYILLLVGLLLMFYEPAYGEILVGLIFGLYYSNELINSIHHIDLFIERQGFVKSLILGGLLIGFLIAAPFIYIGIVLVVGLKYLLMTSGK
jgi:hypothetical protein